MRTPSQTVGPYFSFGLTRRRQNELPGGTVRVEGVVYDGDGEPISDAMLELWHPDHGWGRCGTDDEGRFWFFVPEAAEHFEVFVFARGLLKPALTRLYLRGEPEDATMLAEPGDGGYRFDVRMQGDRATAFFEL